MEKHRIDKNDFDFIEELEQKAGTIESIYEKMFQLELNGQKESKEFKDLLAELRTAIAKEKSLYQLPDLDFARIDALAHFILENRTPDDFKKDMYSIINQEHEGKVERRILGSLIRKNSENYEGVKESLPGIITGFLGMIGDLDGEELDKELTKSIVSSNILQKSIENDTYNGFLTILREFINDPKYAKFREPLLRSKYYLAYINPSLEEGLLSNGFEIPETFYSGAQFAANITGTNNLALEMMQDVYGFPIAIENIGELLTTSDEELMDYNKATTAILRQCILRSLFLYLSTDRIKTLNVSFQQLLEDDDYKGMHPDGQKSEELITECFEAADRDREKQKTLSFGQKPSN